ncbi:MAG TPA: terminase small subunit [Marinobacter sp.]|nr:terminase small subunit [Marinobacter sp.]
MTTKKKTTKKKPSKKKGAKKRVVKKKAPIKKWQATPKQKRFIEEYPIDFNGTQAAIRAKFSKKTAAQQATRLLKNVHIQAAIQKRVGKLTTKVDITVERIVSELAKVGFSNLGEYFRISKDGEPYIDLSAITEEQSAALQEIMVEDFTDGRGDDARNVRRVKIKTLDKLNALDKLGKYLGMFVDRINLTGEIGIKRIERVIVDPEARGKRK